MITTDTFIVILPNKFSVFIRTESGRIIDITGCQPITDNRYGINYNGVLSTAKQVTPEYIADLLSKGTTIAFKKRKKIAKRRATSKPKRILKEEAV